MPPCIHVGVRGQLLGICSFPPPQVLRLGSRYLYQLSPLASLVAFLSAFITGILILSLLWLFCSVLDGVWLFGFLFRQSLVYSPGHPPALILEWDHRHVSHEFHMTLASEVISGIYLELAGFEFMNLHYAQ